MYALLLYKLHTITWCLKIYANVFGGNGVLDMIEKGKQLTLSQRIKIEEMLNQRYRKFEIANELDKSQSTEV